MTVTAPDLNLSLTPQEHQYLKAVTRFRLGLRPSSPKGGAPFSGIPLERRRLIERSVAHMLRPS